jgi:tetratricopeptide (TPR) repeat protein
MADAFGNPYAPNTIGDYESALKFANQSLAIEQNLVRAHPDNQELLEQLAQTEDDLGSTLDVLGRVEEGLMHFQKSLELYRQLASQNPGSAHFADRMSMANFKIGDALMDRNQTREALEQHFLPYGKHWLELAVDPTLDSKEAHACYVAHALVGYAEMQLSEPSKALPQFEEAFRWKKMQVEREPDNARYARDWSQIHSELGTVQIALGRFDEGLTNLADGVRLAEGLVQRDPANGAFQERLVDGLQDEAKGCAKVADWPGISRARQAELWRRAIAALTRCQERLDSPQLTRIPRSQSSVTISGTKQRNEVARALSEARDAYAKFAEEAETHSSSK